MLLEWLVAIRYNRLPKYPNLHGADLVMDYTLLLPNDELDEKIKVSTCSPSFFPREIKATLPELREHPETGKPESYAKLSTFPNVPDGPEASDVVDQCLQKVLEEGWSETEVACALDSALRDIAGPGNLYTWLGSCLIEKDQD